MFRLSPYSRQKSRSADNIKIVIDLIDDTDNARNGSNICSQAGSNLPTYSTKTTCLEQGRSLLKAENGGSHQRRKSLDVTVQGDLKPFMIGSLIPAMKKSDHKTGTASMKGTPKLAPGRTSPLPSKKPLMLTQESGCQLVAASVSGSSGVSEHSTTPGASSEDLVENSSDPGKDVVDSGDNSSRAKQVIESLKDKINKTRESIRREQVMKEDIVNEYLQMATEKQPTARIKALFEKKNQKSAQNIMHLQKKLDSYQQRLKEVEKYGYTGHKQAKEVLRDVGQGFNTIVSKPKEFAHLFKHKFGSADNISQLKLEEPATLEVTSNGNTGTTLPTSCKYISDDEVSSITSGSGPKSSPHFSPHHMTLADSSQTVTLNHSLLSPITDDISEVRDMTHKVNDILSKLVEEFEDFKTQMETDLSLLRSQLDDEKYRAQCLEEQLNDLTELHQHEMMNLRQDLISMEEKIEYRLDERTTDLSDLMDNVSTRISRLEQQQQQQQILSMEMVENATFRTIISKLINVVLAILAVVLVLVSTSANFLSPFVNSMSRLVVSLLIVLTLWLFYHNYHHTQNNAYSVWDLFAWPWR